MKLIKLENLSREEIKAIELIQSHHQDLKTNSSAVKAMVFIYPKYVQLKESFAEISQKYENLINTLENFQNAKDELDKEIEKRRKPKL